jgi:hypothetical protein
MVKVRDAERGFPRADGAPGRSVRQRTDRSASDGSPFIRLEDASYGAARARDFRDEAADSRSARCGWSRAVAPSVRYFELTPD